MFIVIPPALKKEQRKNERIDIERWNGSGVFIE
jgi:hypothetical protein